MTKEKIKELILSKGFNLSYSGSKKTYFVSRSYEIPENELSDWQEKLNRESTPAADTLISHIKGLIDTIENQKKSIQEIQEQYTQMAVINNHLIDNLKKYPELENFNKTLQERHRLLSVREKDLDKRQENMRKVDKLAEWLLKTWNKIIRVKS